jgi:hypothetical protein
MRYSDEIIHQVQLLYVIGIVIWLVLIFILDLYLTDMIGATILLIPIVYLLISMLDFERCSPELESELFQYDILAYGVVIVTIFITFKYPEYSAFFYKLIFAGILLVGLTMLDLWVPREELIIYKHIKTILEIFSVTIFIYIFYTFYYLAAKTDSKDKNPFTDDCKVSGLHHPNKHQQQGV